MPRTNVFIDDEVFYIFACISSRGLGHVSKWVGVNTGYCQKGRCLSCLSLLTGSAVLLFRLVFNSSVLINMHSLEEGKSVLFLAAAAAARSTCGTVA